MGDSRGRLGSNARFSRCGRLWRAGEWRPWQARRMVDHASIEWGRWDNIQTNGNTYSTIQHSIVGQGIVPQRFGCLCESDYLTLSHNLWIDNKSRNPKSKGRIQYVNNVFIAGPESSPYFAGE